MFGFGNKKKEEEEKAAKAEQEKTSQAMRSMSDKIAAQAAAIKKLEDELDDAEEAKAAGSASAAKALAEAQAELRKMKAEIASMKASESKAESAGKAASSSSGSIGAIGGAKAGAGSASPSGSTGGIAGGKIGGAKPAATPKAEEPEPAPVLGSASPEPAAPEPKVGLYVGGTAYVQKAGGKNLRLRNNHGLDTQVLAGLPPGTQLTLLAGPVEDDGYPWWNIRTSDGREGWVAGTELVTSPE